MTCEKCGGSGFLMRFDEEGRTIAKKCECRERMITELRLKASGISDAFQKKSLDNFDTKGNELLTKAKALAEDYIRTFTEIEHTGRNSALFLGNPGSGKTHLSLAIGNALLNDYNVSCLYMPFREEMMKLKQLAREDKLHYEEEMYKLTTARLLIIDDLYKGSVTEADINYVFQIINQRYLNQLPFVVSSEKSSIELLNIDEAIGSRLIEQAKGHSILLNDRKLNYRIYE